MKISQLIMTTTVVLLSASSWTGDLTVDNLTVSSNTAVYGKLDFYSIASSTNTNGVAATGGTITTNGDYRIHTFTNNDTFTISSGSLTCDVLIVAGGGGGGGNMGGGGGGGGVIMITNVVSGDNTVTIGAGGAGSSSATGSGSVGGAGGNTIFGTNTVSGGGGGGGFDVDATSGGSGGGGRSHPTSPPHSGGSGTTAQGNDGGSGDCANPSALYQGGGGGGKNAVGGNADSANARGGNGGEGLTSSISGSSHVYGSGGGGGSLYIGGTPDTTYGLGGTGAGAGGASGNSAVRAPGAATYYGCGGGGGGWNSTSDGNGKSGYQGIVIVRYSINQTTSSNVTTLTVSSNGINQTSADAGNVFMGKVGIGTNNPAEKLHVAGNVQFDGSVKLGNETRTNWPSVAVGALIASNNLSDVENAATARANLGLGSAATNDAGVFMTPTSDGSQLTNITAAQVGALSTNAGALLAANNLSDVANNATARANLGLGSAATNNASAFLTPAGNGSQLTGMTAAQVGALSTNGGVVNGAVSLVSPAGDVPMGVYTNQ